MILLPIGGETLILKTVTAGLVIAAIVSACGGSGWPPSQARTARLFEQQKETFLEIEREMAADGLLRMSPGVFSEMARNPTIPALPPKQATKYLTLFDRTQVFVSVVRHQHSTEFELLIENIGPRLYLSRFIHAATFESLPGCSAELQQLACGTCAIDLERDWQLEYSWFPADPDEEARRC